MIILDLKSPIGKIVKINDGLYRIPCKVYIKDDELDKVEKYLSALCIEYTVEEGEKIPPTKPKEIYLQIHDEISVSDKTEVEEQVTKETEKIEISKKKRKSRKSGSKKNSKKNEESKWSS